MKNSKSRLLLIALLLSGLYGSAQTRTEKDLLGEKQIPADAYYGVQTLRALENFQISGVKTNFYPDYVRAYAMVKLAAARANTEVGTMKKERLDAIETTFLLDEIEIAVPKIDALGSWLELYKKGQQKSFAIVWRACPLDRHNHVTTPFR